MAITIREAVTADLFALHTLYQQLQPDDTTTPDEIAQAFAVMHTHPRCHVFVAEADNSIVGTFVLYILPNMTHNGKPAACLENIVVDERCRGRGVGKAMLAFARDYAQAHKCYKLSLTSNIKREEAHAFYRKCGMVQHGVCFRYSL